MAQETYLISNQIGVVDANAAPASHTVFFSIGGGATVVEADGNINGTTPFQGMVDWDGDDYFFIGFTSTGDPVFSLDPDGNSNETWVLSDSNLFGGTITYVPGGTYNYCFAKGTQISTPSGLVAIEDLAIGDLVLNQEKEAVAVKWLGIQSLHPALMVQHKSLVRIEKGALGDGLPFQDLIVTGDHGMILDGYVVNASVLVNGTTITWDPTDDLTSAVPVYHIETEHHDVILANGVPAETFIDVAGRSAFDNYQEYLDLYGAERVLPAMDRPRISAQRLMPGAIKKRLGIVDEATELDQSLRA